MTDDTLTLEEVFNPAAPDEETELGGLTASLRLAQGFTLLFARCNQPDQRRRLVAILRERLPHLNIQEIELRPIPHLLDELRYQIAEPVPDVIFVSGLEYSLPVAAQAANTPFVLNLNASRNSFSRYIPCPLVLWTPEYVLTAIMHGAPDFFSVRSGVYFFMPLPTATIYKAGLLTSPGVWEVNGLNTNGKIERVVTIKSLLEDYKMLPTEQRDLDVEARLSSTLARFYFSLEEFSASEAVLEESLRYWKQLGNHIAEATDLDNLATLQEVQGRFAEAQASLERSLLLQQNANNTLGEAYTLSNFGNLHFWQGNSAEAEKYYHQAFAIYVQLKDRAGEASSLLALGGVYCQQGHTGDAEKMLQQALTIKRQLGDMAGEAYALNNLAAVYANQGRYVEAEKSMRHALSIFQTLEMRAYEGRSLDNLAVLKYEQGNIEGAISLGEQAVVMLENTEHSSFVTEAKEHLSKWRKQSLHIAQ